MFWTVLMIFTVRQLNRKMMYVCSGSAFALFVMRQKPVLY